MITQKEVKRLFDYDPVSGDLINKLYRGSRSTKGVTSGCVRSCGYRYVKVCGKQVGAHRIVFLWHHGYLPEGEVDHINRNKTDNRIENLREVSRQCQLRNTGCNSKSKTGIKGVMIDIRGKTRWYRAYITNNGKQTKLGYYRSLCEAVFVRFAAEQCLNWSSCDLESSAEQYCKNYLNR